MKRTVLFIALFTAASLVAAAPWTYRGTLHDGGKPANGNYDLRLTLINDAGTQSVSQPLTLHNVAVKDGEFSAEVDFGFDLSTAPPRGDRGGLQVRGFRPLGIHPGGHC